MRKSLLGIVLAATLLPVSLVHAGVKEDLQAGKTPAQIVAKAKADGQDLQDVLAQIIDADPSQGYAALQAVMAADSANASSYASFAVSKGLNPGVVNQMLASSQGNGALGGLGSTGFAGNVNLNTGFAGGGGGGGGGGNASPN